MKDEILKILSETISIIQSGYMNANADLEGISDAADELQRLTCYREVRAYFIAYDELQRQLSWEEFEQEALGIFLGDYLESMILEAIEKVKNEQHAG